MDGCVQNPKDFEFSNKKWFNWASSVDAGKGSTSDNEDYGKRAGWLRVKVASSVLSPGKGEGDVPDCPEDFDPKEPCEGDPKSTYCMYEDDLYYCDNGGWVLYGGGDK